jgi:hypothetical protein
VSSATALIVLPNTSAIAADPAFLHAQQKSLCSRHDRVKWKIPSAFLYTLTLKGQVKAEESAALGQIITNLLKSLS